MAKLSTSMPALPVAIPNRLRQSPFPSLTPCEEEVNFLGDSRAATSGVEICHISMIRLPRASTGPGPRSLQLGLPRQGPSYPFLI